MQTRTDRIAAHDGSFDVRVWLPDSGSGPGLLLVQEIYGVGPYIEKVATDLAARGYVVAAPDLFWRLQPGYVGEHTPEGTQAAIELSQGFDLAQGVADCALTVAHLSALPEVRGGVGALGFCLGGSVDYMLATQVELAAVLSFYGSAVPDATGLMERISSPLLLVFGGSDPYIPRERVAAVEKAAEGRPNVVVHVEEEAGHAFHNSESPMFHQPEPAARAWEVAIAFLDEHLPAR
ncbi:carboxymethylenebutenolidase [[Actinomadura] parvosata subsp. kistnae]|uniref:Carboxymethylenebutenolidase n=1 Tax=[Actinomadura] parvosata subsp. kistnae TaxID=1909395 RepID=A0A1V0ALU5_9ACTN|nr:dienelactone hydrolase family protein [Nonomuraea sp. ATCC 55076]AQZ71187.1 carboxymethylenebutenolidase [Nonomuraea sp. ATCC 55076]